MTTTRTAELPHRLSLRVSSDSLERLDRLVQTMRARSGVDTEPSKVLRAALELGLSALEKKKEVDSP